MLGELDNSALSKIKTSFKYLFSSLSPFLWIVSSFCKNKRFFFPIGPKNQETNAVKRNWPDKVEPSRVVVFPDSAVRGTDATNMQIKEFHPKGGKGKWLAVHIPDHMPYPRRNVKIIASRKAVSDLHKVVGPNKASLAMEIQSLLGVDEDTLNQMIRQGERDKEETKDEEENDEDDDEGESDVDQGGDDNDDDDIGDPLDDEETSADCNDPDDYDHGKIEHKLNGTAKHREAKICKNSKAKFAHGYGIANHLKEHGDIEKELKLHVEQPEGFELRWEEILNNFKNFDAKRKKKICKLFRIQNNVCQRLRRRKHRFQRKLRHYLLRMLRKFLRKNKNDFQDYLSGK